MRALTEHEYMALRPPAKVISPELFQELRRRGLVYDYFIEGRWHFGLTSLGALALRVHETSVGVRRPA